VLLPLTESRLHGRELRADPLPALHRRDLGVVDDLDARPAGIQKRTGHLEVLAVERPRVVGRGLDLLDTLSELEHTRDHVIHEQPARFWRLEPGGLAEAFDALVDRLLGGQQRRHLDLDIAREVLLLRRTPEPVDQQAESHREHEQARHADRAVPPHAGASISRADARIR
jgi:hypothetical protein